MMRQHPEICEICKRLPAVYGRPGPEHVTYYPLAAVCHGCESDAPAGQRIDDVHVKMYGHPFIISNFKSF